MSPADQVILNEFVAESNDHLTKVEGLLLGIESSGAACDLAVVNRVFRAIHSIKGAAGFIGLDKINDLAHSCENILNRMRSRTLTPDSRIIDQLLRGCDLLRVLINAAGQQRQAEYDQADIRPLVTALNGYAQQTSLPGISEQNHLPHSQGQTQAEALVTDGRGAACDPLWADAGVRVSVAILDKLVNLASELALNRSQLLQALRSPAPAGLGIIAAHIDQLTNELQTTILQTRRQPLAHVFERFPRVVRDLSAKLGKHCDLVINGQDVEVDKAIIEAIGDPLVHLIRNALDHGIEHADARVHCGKHPTGTLTLEGRLQAGCVHLVVRDDGAGIDTAKIRAKAIAQGLITVEQGATLWDRDALELVFEPGFSTADEVTDISGRGVGMDVVKDSITRLGGTIDIHTQIGRGTEMHIKLPLALPIVPAIAHVERQSNSDDLVRVKSRTAATQTAAEPALDVLRLRG